jgi:predicted negative regulator of RcsB-dependent stress response
MPQTCGLLVLCEQADDKADVVVLYVYNKSAASGCYARIKPMSKESAFDRKHIETVTESRRDILEELNLPPQVISFLRQHARVLQIGALCLVLITLGWVAYDGYTDKRQENATALLAEAIREPAGERRLDLLRQVETRYAGTDAAIWSRVQLAHAAEQAGDTPEAITRYQSVLKDLAAGNPLTPLIHYSLGQAHEAGGDPDQALSHYQRLATYPGFAARGLHAVGRIHELQNRPSEAIKAYEQLAALGEQPGLEKGFVENKLAILKQ